MTTPAAPRRRSIVPGILLGVLGVILLAIGGGIYGVSAIGESLQAGSPTEVTQTFEAENLAAGGYAIYLTDDLGEPLVSDPVSALTCAVENGGDTQTVVADPFSSAEVGSSELIGSFRSTGGAASVTCTWIDGHASTGYTFAVLPSSGPPVAAIVLFILGGVAILGGGLLILLRVMARART